MNPDYPRFVQATMTAGRNITIIFAAVVTALVAYKSIDWYPVKWQKVTRIAAQTFAILLLAATVALSL